MSKNDNDKFIQKLYNESIKRKEKDEICKMKIVNHTILRAEENTKLSEKISKLNTKNSKENKKLNLKILEIEKKIKSIDKTEPEKKNKKKILCLHGGGQSAYNFSQQKGMLDLKNNLKDYEFIFAESPLKNNLWWNNPKDKSTPTKDINHANESINYLFNFINKNGPFYCILGYSQGCAMALLYLSKNLHKFEKMILFNGYLPKTHLGLMTLINKNSPYLIDTLIFIGKNDVFYNMSLELKSKFTNLKELISQSAGHHLPYKSDDNFFDIINFIKNEKKPKINSEFILNNKKWNNHDIQNYSFTFNWSCFCTQEYVKLVNIKVMNNKIFDIIDVKSQKTINKNLFNNYKTIDQLFDFISNEYENSDSVNVKYNEKFGYPINGYFDRIKLAIDDEMAFNISDFKIDNGFVVIENNRYQQIENKIEINTFGITRDFPPSVIQLEYKDCKIRYEIIRNPSENSFGYYYNGNLYRPTNKRMLRYSKSGIVTMDYIYCRISIIIDRITIE